MEGRPKEDLARWESALVFPPEFRQREGTPVCALPAGSVDCCQVEGREETSLPLASRLT